MRRSKYEAVIGTKINRWLILGIEKNGMRRCFRVRCDCGTEAVRDINPIVNGKSTSCGCYQREVVSKEGERTRHGSSLAITNSLYVNYKNRAERKRLQFELSRNEFRSFLLEPCFYCGRTKTQVIEYRDKNDLSKKCLYYNGIDRKDSTIGYIKDNIVTCCKTCNYGKRDLTYDEWVTYLKSLVEFRKNLP